MPALIQLAAQSQRVVHLSPEDVNVVVISDVDALKEEAIQWLRLNNGILVIRAFLKLTIDWSEAVNGLVVECLVLILGSESIKEISALV